MSVVQAQTKITNQHMRRNPPIPGEAEAIEAAQSGDTTSFEILYAMHKRRVYSLCLRMLSNVAEAEDLTQEAFLQLYRKIGTFRGDSAFSTWLHRLAVNVVLMHLRRKGLPQVSLEETLEPTQEDGPRRDIGAATLFLPARSTASPWSGPSRTCRPAIASFLCCTMSKATSIMRSRNARLLDRKQ